MPTQIIDNFDLTSQLPLDARLVVGPNAFFQTRDAIKNKYYGLRIWDFNDNLPYVWTGNSWENENSGSVLVSNGQGGYISKFTGTGTSNTITKSIIYEYVSGSSNKVGINLSGFPSEVLEVNGNIKSSGTTGFIGKGGSITEISATNITTGALSLSRLFTTGVVSGSLIFYDGSAPIWKPKTQIRVASSTGIEITDENTDSNLYDVIFYKTTNTVSDSQTPTSYRVSSSTTSGNLQFKPSTGQLRLSNGTSLDPGFTFKGHPNGRAGMFLDLSNGPWWNGGLVITFEQNQGAPASGVTSKGERLRIIGGGSSGNWASNFFFHSNNYISKNLLLSVSDGGVTTTAPGKATFYSNSLSEVEWLNQGNFTIGSSTLRTTTTINGSLTILPGALTNQALTINGVTTINAATTINNTLSTTGQISTSSTLRLTSVNFNITQSITSQKFQISANSDTIELIIKPEQYNNEWSSKLYIGNTTDYISVEDQGQFKIASSNDRPIQILTGTSVRMYISNSNGNVGIGTTNPTSKLTVNGNIRTDSDFVTGTDTAGWSTDPVTYGSVKQFWTSNSTWQNLTPASGSVFRWKIIGKTLILKFYIETTGDLGANGGVFQIRIPTALQSKIQNHLPTPSGNLLGYQLEDSIIMAPAYGYLWAQVRKYNNEAFPNEWILYMNNTNALYTITNGGDFRGNVILELI